MILGFFILIMIPLGVYVKVMEPLSDELETAFWGFLILVSLVLIVFSLM